MPRFFSCSWDDDTLARQVLWQGPAPALLAVRLLGVRQSRVRKINGIRLVGVGVALVLSPNGALLGFVEDAIHVLFAARRKPMQPRQRQFFLELEDALREDVPLSLQRGDFVRMRRQKRLQLLELGPAFPRVECHRVEGLHLAPLVAWKRSRSA